MHCVAGDGVGILAGAVIAGFFHLSKVTDVTLEYLLGFGFGWAIFQALFMRDEAGGSYARAFSSAFLPELLSMNCLMAGMVPTMILAKNHIPTSDDPSGPAFWFVMSMALLVGFITAYPMNWWLVSNHMKHGMMTVRTSQQREINRAYESTQEHHIAQRNTENARPKGDTAMHGDPEKVSRGYLVRMTMLSFLVFSLGLSIVAMFGGQ